MNEGKRAQIAKYIREHVFDRLVPDAEGFTWRPVTIGGETIGTRGDRFRFSDPTLANAIHPGRAYAEIVGSFGDGRLDFGGPQFGEVGTKGFLGHKEARRASRTTW